jgi:hypothetical protein
MPQHLRPADDNLVTLDLTRFTSADIQKLEALRNKVVLLRRWYRHERVERNGREFYVLYSGDSGPQAYASYVVSRRENGSYALQDARSEAPIADGRTIDAVIEALPEDFYFTKHLT